MSDYERWLEYEYEQSQFERQQVVGLRVRLRLDGTVGTISAALNSDVYLVDVDGKVRRVYVDELEAAS